MFIDLQILISILCTKLFVSSWYSITYLHIDCLIYAEIALELVQPDVCDKF